MNILISRIAERIYKGILDSNSKISLKILLFLRNIILHFTNPIIMLTFRGYKLSFPFSHTIFYFQKLYPNYDRELHKIGLFLQKQLGILNMIDVGANIGDTAVFTNVANANYLLIEGERSYAELISKNISYNYVNNGGGDIIIEHSFVSDNMQNYTISLQDGSGKLIINNVESGTIDSINLMQNTANMSLKSLDMIVNMHRFTPNFIKIDTDGFDFKVLRSAKKTLLIYKPAIYFEWDKFHLETIGENPTAIFEYLHAIGYEELLIFDNFGTLLCKLDSSDVFNLSLLMDYTLESNRNIYYYDVLSFHKDNRANGVSIEDYLIFTKSLKEQNAVQSL